jgi:2',3'-cyclic-nucleotide 2'-phosphodiesterase
MSASLTVLVIGDIVGKPGRTSVADVLPKLQAAESIDFVIANAENAAGGSGITPGIAQELFGLGVHVLTSGNHIWSKREIYEVMQHDHRILRPINYPKASPGVGAAVYDVPRGPKIGVVNVMGRVFMDSCDCPFHAVTAAVAQLRKETPIIMVDMHAEATSEKIAMGWHLDGTVSCVFGTHTHVQTADERILPEGTAHITDVGMTGPHDSVIGRRTDQVLHRFVTHMPIRYEMATENPQLHGALVTIDARTGRATAIRRVAEQAQV